MVHNVGSLCPWSCLPVSAKNACLVRNPSVNEHADHEENAGVDEGGAKEAFPYLFSVCRRAAFVYSPQTPSSMKPCRWVVANAGSVRIWRDDDSTAPRPVPDCSRPRARLLHARSHRSDRRIQSSTRKKEPRKQEIALKYAIHNAVKAICLAS